MSNEAYELAMRAANLIHQVAQSVESITEVELDEGAITIERFEYNSWGAEYELDTSKASVFSVNSKDTEDVLLIKNSDYGKLSQVQEALEQLESLSQQFSPDRLPNDPAQLASIIQTAASKLAAIAKGDTDEK